MTLLRERNLPVDGNTARGKSATQSPIALKAKATYPKERNAR